ncbi:putative cytochrome P450 6g2 [Trichinella pseudospiralis]|uniref:Uncharacterized protein n=1 Tax=Trichinella pseudospiralis TaxID=6337 RepID=A0A0V1FK11_TRIPS|nr:hypothetical protein T4D_16210 [Trichinella pseudospiralis]
METIFFNSGRALIRRSKTGRACPENYLRLFQSCYFLQRQCEKLRQDTLADFVHHLGYVGIVVFTALTVCIFCQQIDADLKNFPKPLNYLETELSSLDRILYNR